jgi:monoamine oxidase
MSLDLLASTKADPALLAIVRSGLPPTRRKAHAIVIGAGMAGLVAASELHRAGHRVTVLEGRNRVGGRIYTVRDAFADGLAAEVGAMRIPTAHTLTMAYIERLGLPTVPFLSDNPAAYCLLRGQRRRNDVPVDDLFDLRSDERGLGLEELLKRSLAPIRAELAAGAPGFTDRWERTSLREFLERSGWSSGAIEMFGVLSRHESLMDTAFLEFFRGSNHVSSPMVRIPGGMDQLPQALARPLQEQIRFGCTVRGVVQGPDFVRVQVEGVTGRRTVTGDYAIVTLPYSLWCHVEVTPELSAAKQRAIRQIHYDNATKIFMQFRKRFWEDEGIRFGTSVTDLPIRNVVYPEAEAPTPRGLLLASYTWAQDAQRWGAVTDLDRQVQALDNLARIHPRAPEFYEHGLSHVWQADPFAGGAYTVFQPGQQARLHADICRPEGRLHFAGEHTSLLHRWVEGAVESGLRAAREVAEAAQRRGSLDGSVMEVTRFMPVDQRGGDAFRKAAMALMKGEVEGLAAVLAQHPEVVRQRCGGLPPFDEEMAGSTLLHLALQGAAARDAGRLLAQVRTLTAAGADVGAHFGLAEGQQGSLTLLARRGPGDGAQLCVIADELLRAGADLEESDGAPLHGALTRVSWLRAANPSAGRGVPLVAGDPTRALAAHLRHRGATVDLALAAGLGERDTLRSLVAVGAFRPEAYGRYRPERDRLDPSDRDALLGEGLVFAALCGQLHALAALLDLGADPSATCSVHGVHASALHHAAAGGHVAVIRRLIEAGADVQRTDAEWTATPLGWAIAARAEPAIELLLAVPGVLINDLVCVRSPSEVDEALRGRHPDHAHAISTPGVLLRNAAFAGRADVCALLVARGASLELPSSAGQLPWEVAAAAGHGHLAQKLKPSLG